MEEEAAPSVLDCSYRFLEGTPPSVPVAGPVEMASETPASSHRGASGAALYFSSVPIALTQSGIPPAAGNVHTREEAEDQVGPQHDFLTHVGQLSSVAESPRMAYTEKGGASGKAITEVTNSHTLQSSRHSVVDRLQRGNDTSPVVTFSATEEEQVARLRAYDTQSGPSTLDYLRDTEQALVPDALHHFVETTATFVASRSVSAVPRPLRRAAKAATEHIEVGAEALGGAIEAVPRLVVQSIPNAVLSSGAKQLIFVDFSNVLRSFFHTNILSMPYVLNKAGLVAGLLLLFISALTAEYATEAYFDAKNQMKAASTVVVYGDVPHMIWGEWYPMLNIFYGTVHLISFIAFTTSNTVVLLTSLGVNEKIATPIAFTVPFIMVFPLVLMKRARSQRPLAVLSNTLILISVVLLLVYFPYGSVMKAASIKLWPTNAADFFVAQGVAVYACTGLGTAVSVERTMRPERYTRLLRVSVGLSLALLVSFGVLGFLSFGDRTCSVISVSLRGGPGRTAVSTVLFVASLVIIPQQTFPLCELCDRRLLGIRGVPTYWKLGPNLLRFMTLAGGALVAYVVPYYGLLLAIGGSLGCGILGLIVPAGLDYVRRQRWGLQCARHLRWWEYMIVFGLGGGGCEVVVIGVAYGLYEVWLAVQANAWEMC